MPQTAADQRLSLEVDSQPPVQAALALRPAIRGYHDEIEREQRLPKALVEQFHAAGFYSMVIPRALGGLQVDPLTYLRVVEVLSESAGSVGWNVANNSIGQLVTLGLPDDGVREIYATGADTVIAGTAVMGGGRAVPVPGGYRVSGRWRFGSGCQESSWMLGSFQIFDGDTLRKSPDGNSSFWRGVFPRAEAAVVDGSWDVSGLRGTGSFDWTVEDVFLPERRTMIHAGVPLDNQWSRWPGISYALPAQAWVGPHHSAVITGIARAGIDALVELAGGKTPRGRTGLLCENPQVQDGGRPGGCDARRRPRPPERDDRRALEHDRRRRADDAGAARPLPARRGVRRRQRARRDGPDVPARRQHVVRAREPARRVLARPARRRPDGDDRAGVVSDRRARAARDGPGPAPALTAVRAAGCLRRPASGRVCISGARPHRRRVREGGAAGASLDPGAGNQRSAALVHRDQRGRNVTPRSMGPGRPPRLPPPGRARIAGAVKPDLPIREMESQQPGSAG